MTQTTIGHASFSAYYEPNILGRLLAEEDGEVKEMRAKIKEIDKLNEQIVFLTLKEAQLKQELDIMKEYSAKLDAKITKMQRRKCYAKR